MAVAVFHRAKIDPVGLARVIGEGTERVTGGPPYDLLCCRALAMVFISSTSLIVQIACTHLVLDLR
jgi:hypothetical protein